MESKNYYFPIQKNLQSYKPKLARLVLNYIHWREVQKLGDSSTKDIKNTFNLSAKHTGNIIRKLEADGYITRYVKDKYKYCILTEEGRSLLLEYTLIHFPRDLQPEVRRMWSSIP